MSPKRDPGRAYLLRDLLASGFSAALARNLVERLPAGDARKLTIWAKKALAKNLPIAMNDEIVTRGGVYALTGPTGVGKTTTTAKLAARCVVRHGTDKLALITTDSYRIGAYEHLKIYGRILGVSVHAARDEQELKSALANLRGKHVVLIDTIGMSQRDKQVAEQVAMLSGAGPVQRLLLLNATCHADTLEDVVRVYGGPEVAGCILTKTDRPPLAPPWTSFSGTSSSFILSPTASASRRICTLRTGIIWPTGRCVAPIRGRLRLTAPRSRRFWRAAVPP